MSKLRIAQYGCGKMSKYSMRYVYEKGAEIVAAFDVNPSVIGRDISAIIGGPERGVVVHHADEADKVLAALKPDACIITTMSLMRDIVDALMVCARNGVNAITTNEEAIFPMNSSPSITSEVDAMAKKTGCTVCGSGYQDVFWGNLIATLAGAMHTISKIKGSSSYNVEVRAPDPQRRVAL